MIQTSFGAHASRFRRIRSGALRAGGRFLIAGCEEPNASSVPAPEGAPPSATAAESATEASHPEQDAFWATHCGGAYEGELPDATPHYAGSLSGRRPGIHFRDCTDDRIHVAFHLDDDASRNWIVTRVGGTLRLKQDHRQSVRFSFDLSRTVETPSTPWGYEGDAP